MNRNLGGDQNILKNPLWNGCPPERGQHWKIIYRFKVEIQVFRRKIGDLYYVYRV